MKEFKSILVTGGSSGIGEALALAFAAPGVFLAITGRNEERLAGVAEACGAKGARVKTARIDVTEREALAGWIAELDSIEPLDLVIANAGISAGTGGGGEDEEQTRQIMAVNVGGVMNTVMPAAALMQGRRRGQIAINASLAAFRGFPGAPAYCASKAAARIWGESLRGHLAADGVGVTVICPGYVKSRMTAVNEFPMPFLMEAERAAEIIKRGLARNKSRITFPWPLAATIWLLAALPPAWTDRMLRGLPKKG